MVTVMEGLEVVIPARSEKARANEGAGCSPHYPCYGAPVGLGCLKDRAVGVLGGVSGHWWEKK